MHKKNIKTGWILLLSLLVAGFSALSAEAAEYTFKYGFSHPLTHPHGIGAKCFQYALEEFTKGRVQVRLYPGAALGDDNALMDSIRLGTVEMGSTTCAGVALVAPEYDIFGLPFLFRDYEHVMKAFQGPLGNTLTKALEKHGFHVLGFSTSGFRQIFQRKPINSIKDLKGSTIRVQETPGIIEAIKAIGARPVPVPWSEVYTALQTGVVDGGETSIQAYIGNKLYEQSKHIARVNYMDAGRAFFMNKKYFDAFPPDLQKAVERAARVHARVTHTEYERQDWLSAETLKKVKAILYFPDMEPFKEAVQVVYDKLPVTLGKDWVKKIQAIE